MIYKFLLVLVLGIFLPVYVLSQSSAKHLKSYSIVLKAYNTILGDEELRLEMQKLERYASIGFLYEQSYIYADRIEPTQILLGYFIGTETAQTILKEINKELPMAKMIANDFAIAPILTNFQKALQITSVSEIRRADYAKLIYFFGIDYLHIYREDDVFKILVLALNEKDLQRKKIIMSNLGFPKAFPKILK